MSKRGNGEGTTYKRKDGRWVSAVSLKLPSGKSSKLYHYGSSRKECVEWRINMLEEIKKGKSPVTSSMLLITWLERWLNEYCINIRDSTRMNYVTYINHHIKRSVIGDKPINQLTTHDLQIFCNFLVDSGRLDGKGGLSPKTVRNIFNMIHAALKQAVGNQLIFSNPADYVVLPKTSRTEVNVLDLKSQASLLKACEGEKWKIGIVLMLGTGLRIGELLALKHSSVKQDGSITYLDVSKSLHRVTDFENTSKRKAKTILGESETKTENSKRRIPVSSELKTSIFNFIARQKSGMKCDDPYLISNDDGGFVDPTTFRNWFNKIVCKAGIEGRVTPHTLRHTFASTALRYGMDMKNISSLLGHYSTDFTARTYIHTDLEGQLEAIEKMNEQVVAANKGGLPC